MPVSAEKWLTNLERWWIMKDGEWEEDHSGQHHQHWGFTIYRTSYGNDEQWEKLLQKITSEAQSEMIKATKLDEEDPKVHQLWSLFRLDARSDITLAGLDVHDIRGVFNATPAPPGFNFKDTFDLVWSENYRTILNNSPFYREKLSNVVNDGKDYPMNVFISNQRVCLVADEEVLADPELRTVKCVDADNNPYEHPCHGRAQQLYWGWMQMTTCSLVCLWHELETYLMHDIAPSMFRGVPFETWDHDKVRWW